MLLRWLAKLPLGALHALAPPLHIIAYYVVRYRRDVVRKNLHNSFPEKSTAEIESLEKKFYRQLIDVLLEAVKANTMTEAEFRQRVHLENADIFDQHIHNKQSIILLAAHHCNWEWLLPACNIFLPFAVDAVYKPLHQKFVDEFMLQTRSRFGAKPIPHKSAVMDIMQRRNEMRAFAMVADQSPKRKEEKHWMQFLHQETSFQMGMAKIPQMTKYPVYFAYMRRERRGHYAVQFIPLAEPPYTKGDMSIIESYVQALEHSIAAQPEAWLWTNDKWSRLRGIYE
ncbi:MAG: lysophospholipid acyltransferase family protein [Pseudomonadales bacterium]